MLSIFVPGPGMSSQETLIQLGCGPLLDKTVAAMRIDAMVVGPDGKSGTLFYIDTPGSGRRPIVSVELSTQEWQEAARDGEQPRGRYWLGFLKGSPPMPEDFQRSQLVDGQPVELADGRKWVIPIADLLPKRLKFDPETGREIEVVAERYSSFTNEANSLFEHMLSDDFVKVVEGEHIINVPNGLQFAVDALCINYRVNRELVDMLGLISKVEAFRVVEVASGIAMLRDVSQKKTLLSEICEL